MVNSVTGGEPPSFFEPPDKWFDESEENQNDPSAYLPKPLVCRTMMPSPKRRSFGEEINNLNPMDTSMLSMESKDTAISSVTAEETTEASWSDGTTTPHDVSSVAMLRGWLNDFGEKHKKHCEQTTHLGTPSLHVPLEKPMRAKVHPKPVAPAGPTPLPQHTANALTKRLNEQKQKERRNYATPVRIKPKFEAAEVQATNEGYASVAKLSAWLADDPTSRKKVKSLRRGANVIAKSRKFDKGLANVIVENNNLKRGHVKEKMHVLEITPSTSDDVDELSTASEGVHAAPRTNIVVGETKSTLVMRVSDKRQWLAGAFKKSDSAVVAPKAKTDLVTAKDHRDEATARAKHMWRQRAPTRGQEEEKTSVSVPKPKVVLQTAATKPVAKTAVALFPVTQTKTTPKMASAATPALKTAPPMIHGPASQVKSVNTCKPAASVATKVLDSEQAAPPPKSKVEDQQHPPPTNLQETQTKLSEENAPTPLVVPTTPEPIIVPPPAVRRLKPTISAAGIMSSEKIFKARDPSLVIASPEVSTTRMSTSALGGRAAGTVMEEEIDMVPEVALTESTLSIPNTGSDLTFDSYRRNSSVDMIKLAVPVFSSSSDSNEATTFEKSPVSEQSPMTEDLKPEDQREPPTQLLFTKAEGGNVNSPTPTKFKVKTSESKGVHSRYAFAPKPVEVDLTKSEEEEGKVDFRTARDMILQRAKKNGKKVEVVNKVTARKAMFEQMGKSNRRKSLLQGNLKTSWQPQQGAKYEKTFVEDVVPKRSFEDLP